MGQISEQQAELFTSFRKQHFSRQCILDPCLKLPELVSLPGTIDAFSWNYCVIFAACFTYVIFICLIFLRRQPLSINIPSASTNLNWRYKNSCQTVIASDYGKQNNMKNVNSSLRQSLNNFFAFSTALLSWGPPAKQKKTTEIPQYQ